MQGLYIQLPKSNWDQFILPIKGSRAPFRKAKHFQENIIGRVTHFSYAKWTVIISILQREFSQFIKTLQAVCNQSAVSASIQRFQQSGSVSQYPRSGRPHVSRPRDEAYMCQIAPEASQSHSQSINGSIAGSSTPKLSHLDCKKQVCHAYAYCHITHLFSVLLLHFLLTWKGL